MDMAGLWLITTLRTKNGNQREFYDYWKQYHSKKENTESTRLTRSRIKMYWKFIPKLEKKYQAYSKKYRVYSKLTGVECQARARREKENLRSVAKLIEIQIVINVSQNENLHYLT